MSGVLFIAGDADGAEERAAFAWLQSTGLAIHPASFATPGADAVADADRIWVHAGLSTAGMDDDVIAALGDRVRARGRLLLSLRAARLVVPLGLESDPPGEHGIPSWSDDLDPLWPEAFRDWPNFPHIRGLQGWGAHPLFRGLVRGTFTWRATEGDDATEATYVLPRWPSGRVIAVERAYVQLNAAKAVAWEYRPAAGHVICIGAHLRFAAASRSLDMQRDALARNALALLDAHGPAASDWWPSPAIPALPLDPGRFRTFSLGASMSETASELAMMVRPFADDPWTLSGRRALVVGGERSGIREIWVHPLCLVSGGIALRIDGHVPEIASVEIAPECIVRHLRTPALHVEERTLVLLDEGAAVVEYSHRSPDGAIGGSSAPSIELRLSLPLRLQWPMPADALHPLATIARSTDGATACWVVGRDERCVGVVHVEGDAEIVGDRDADGAAPPRIAVRGSLAATLRVTFAATALGVHELERTFQSIALSGVDGELRRRAEHMAALRRVHVAVASPSASLDLALEWAKVRMSGFLASVPGLGAGLFAGFAASRDGWGMSRPGYAWFFGRDACWTARAMLGAGMFEEVREAIDFLVKTQDVSGKIIHELSASGAAHYDAADSTPLFLSVVGAYARWTGGLEVVRDWWPAVRKAVAFVETCDRDDDGLPENTDVGHGWIESGPLGGGEITAYVAAIWIDALEGIAELAPLIGDRALGVHAAEQAGRARRAFAEALYDGATSRHALQRMADGSLVATLTALDAVPILLGIVGGDEAQQTLAALASDEFSAPWGVRLISRRDPLYAPTGYHSGSIWPLYTGWVSLAEFVSHRGEAGYAHLLANAASCFERAKGAFDEVLHGDERRAAGICPDQAWSAAMVVLPLIDGMLGAVPRAWKRQLTLAPHWPANWTHARLTSLRVGDAMLDVEMKVGCMLEGTTRVGTTYRVRCTPPGALTLVLEHPVDATGCARVFIDDAEVAWEASGTATCPHAQVTIAVGNACRIAFVAGTPGDAP